MNTQPPHRLLIRSALTLALTPWVFIGAACDRAKPPPAVSEREHTIATSERNSLVFAHAGLEFDAVIDAPRAEASNGWGVLLIGGGLGNDLDWTTPGSLIVEGREQRFTIDGRSHADAPALARSLAQRGFTVMRWSTIARGDPLAKEWPLRATPRTNAELIAQARAALATLRERIGITSGHIVLVGHSLGAARACAIAVDDDGVRGLVLLSPAYATLKVPVPKSIAAGEIRSLAGVLEKRPIPTLAVFGSRDASKPVDAQDVAGVAAERYDGLLEVRVFEGFGHQLGPIEGSLVGPIDTAVTTAVAEWVSALTGDGR